MNDAFTCNITVIPNVFGFFCPSPLYDWHTIVMIVRPCFHSKYNLIYRHINWRLNDEKNTSK